MAINSISCLDEPLLEFADGQVAEDPHDGLAMFGSFSSRAGLLGPSPPRIAIGTPEGLRLWNAWSDAMPRSAAVSDSTKQRLWPPFPGYDVAFGSRWEPRSIQEFSVDREELLIASRKKDRHERCYAVVNQILEHLPTAKKLEPSPALAICVIPDELYSNCRPKSYVIDPSDEGISAKEKEDRIHGQKVLFGDNDYSREQYLLAPDFRRQLKARLMKFDVPVQIIRESTLRLSDEPPQFGARGLTPLSDRMWNLSTALHYKGGGKPWKLSGAREGVCYIGIAYRRTDKDGRSACCAAQMFLDDGDGIVFLGEFGPWYSPERKQFHLSPDAAEKLLRGTLDTYERLHGKELTEVFLHCRSGLDVDEFEGFQASCPPDCNLVGIRVRKDREGPRLFRAADMPVMRGTFWTRNERNGLLFGAGFKPRIATYDGWETPVPLQVTVQHGEAELENVAKDILGLTKLNYNACRLGESQPITIKFSDAVGEILIANPTIAPEDRRHTFKYYV